METKMYLHEPEEVSFTMVLTMETGEWRLLYDQLDANATGPARDLKIGIRSLLAKAESTFAFKDPEAAE